MFTETKSVRQVLLSAHYTEVSSSIDFCWETHHVEGILDDLYSSFRAGDKTRGEFNRYEFYTLGGLILWPRSDGDFQLPDGELKLVTLTLLLAYLMRLAGERSDCPTSQVRSLVFSEQHGDRILTLDLGPRTSSLEKLVEGRESELRLEDDRDARLLARYRDIEAGFPDEFKADALTRFMDWLINYVTLLTVTAASEDEAYEIHKALRSEDSWRHYVAASVASSADRAAA
jgi:hypothetical protein